MAYALTISEGAGYLHFRVTGRNSKENVMAYLAEVHAACKSRQCPAALVEENLSGPSLPIAEIFRIASAGSAATAPSIRALAVVDVNPEHSHEKMRFAENVAVTRGINVRVFDTVSAAQEWVQNQAALLRASGSQAT